MIIGTPYLDVGGSCKVALLGNDQLKSKIKFHKKGWLARDAHKVEGSVTKGKKKDQEVLYKVHGNWNSKIYINSELVFQKSEYPENWQFMYGMTGYVL